MHVSPDGAVIYNRETFWQVVSPADMLKSCVHDVPLSLSQCVQRYTTLEFFPFFKIIFLSRNCCSDLSVFASLAGFVVGFWLTQPLLSGWSGGGGGVGMDGEKSHRQNMKVRV